VLLRLRRFIASPASKKSSVVFGPYRKTNPQNSEDHIGDPGRQQMSGRRNHHNYRDQQGHIGLLDAIFGGHTAPLAVTPVPHDLRLEATEANWPSNQGKSSGFRMNSENCSGVIGSPPG
jgi:hypothetical protein